MTDSRSGDPLEEDDQTDIDDEDQTLHDLRVEYREVKKKLKAADGLEAEIREEVTRDFNIEYHLKRYGHPAAMLDTVKEKLDDGSVLA